MFIERNMKPWLVHYASKFRVIAVVGPRQSGKTTLVKETFPNHKYFSFENPTTLAEVKDDPEAFLRKDYGTQGIILDEFQNDPQILSYMQGIVDEIRRPGYFVITGSHNFLMNQAITQSLAGRVAIFTLLPLSLKELKNNGRLAVDINKAVFAGGYPDVAAKEVSPLEFYPQYTKTYTERVVRQLLNVVDLSEFQYFMRLCAARIGQLLNISSLATDCGISVPTAKKWISILEASYVIFRLQPHFNNFNKRFTKSAKLYFYDTGLACWLLNIKSSEQVLEHYLRGGLIESLIISELHKKFFNQAEEPNLYFWRDSHGNEIDGLLDYGTRFIPLEIKSSGVVNQHFFDGIHYWCKLANVDPTNGFVIYGGRESYGNNVSWQDAADVIPLRAS